MRISDWSSDVCSSDLFHRRDVDDREFAAFEAGMARGRRPLALRRQLDRPRTDGDAADHAAVGVGVVEPAFAGTEQILAQVAIAQLGIRHLLHPYGRAGIDRKSDS